MVQAMSASRAISFRVFLSCLLALAASGVLAQTSVDDVHVTTRENTVSLASTAYPGSYASGGLIRTSVDLVLVPVTITDPLNRPVVGLAEDNFRLFENKKPQAIRHFSSEDAPVSLGIIMDTSGSMSDKIERARDAVTRFCEAANPEDEFFLITFSDEPRLAADFTPRPENVESELVGTHPKGRTALLDAIYMGLEKMRQARYGRKALLIISDGGDNHSRYNLHDVKSAIKEADVMIYAVGTYDRYFPTMEEVMGPELLSDLAGPTGGQAFTLTNPNDMPDVARRIGIQLRHQYLLGYRPPSAIHDGQWHKISVKLSLSKQLPFLHIHARAGYYASAQ